MLSPPLALAATGIAIVIATVFISFRQSPNTFNVPFVGFEEGDLAKAKFKYVHEADQILRDGFRKVSSRLPELQVNNLRLSIVSKCCVPSHDS